jgi:hypothetical protein
MTIVDLLLYLREKLLEARARKESKELQTLWDTINAVLECSYQHGERQIATLLEEMGDAIRDSLMGVEWKSTIPSEESIRAIDGKTI